MSNWWDDRDNPYRPPTDEPHYDGYDPDPGIMPPLDPPTQLPPPSEDVDE